MVRTYRTGTGSVAHLLTLVLCLLAVASAGAFAQDADKDSAEAQNGSAAPVAELRAPEVATETEDEDSDGAVMKRIKAGLWRLELTGAAAMSTGQRSRSGDSMIVGTVEYEVPATGRLALGLRLLPFLLYNQDDGDTVYALGTGITTRIYFLKDKYRGPFIEGEAHALYNVNEFAGNSGNVNFLTGGGVGYKWKANWHAVLKFEHISNASTTSDNDGVNTLGLGIGYSF